VLRGSGELVADLLWGSGGSGVVNLLRDSGKLVADLLERVVLRSLPAGMPFLEV